MNLYLELEETIRQSIDAQQVDVPEEFATLLFSDIRNWMDKNQVVLYQP